VLPQYDLVHIHSFWNAAVAVTALACRRRGIPYVISPRGMLQSNALARKRAYKEVVYRLWERRTIDSASFFHFFTQAEAADSKNLLGKETKVVLIPNGVDPALDATVHRGRFKANHPELAQKKVVLFLGRLHWSKGLELQVDALGKLPVSFPDIMWVFAGPDDGEIGRLTSMLEAKKLMPYALFTGMLSRAASLEALADVDVFVLSSRHEAHSMAMNEALALGTPVVLTESVGYDEVATAGCGIVTPSTGEALAEGISRVLGDPLLALRMRERAKQYAAERLAWPKVAAAMAQVYESILQPIGTFKAISELEA
jgi:glycosyltransferase involved in cell wall biosynthesis